MSRANAHNLLREGTVIAGKYRVERVLGAGGMGVVVAARHIVLDERVALKFLLPDGVASVEAIGRLIREARAATRIKSEHVARVSDVGQLEDGSPFIVMEYLEGADLASLLVQRGAMPVEQAVDFVLQACEAIAEAHQRGIVHRDLKPANLFCVTKPDGALSIKVLDFGISKVTTPGDTDHKLTKASSVIGSPVYMSPEQMRRSSEVDERTDIWALGVILFELLTARVPFDAETAPELIIKVATESPAPLRALRPTAPVDLELAIVRCLEKDRARRFQNVGELASALQRFGSSGATVSVQAVLGTLARLDISSVRNMSDLPPAPALGEALQVRSGGRTDLSWGGATGGSKSRRRVGVLAGLSVVALVAALGVVAHFVRAPVTDRGAATGDVSAAPPVDMTLAPPTVPDPQPAAPPATGSAAASAPPARAQPGAIEPSAPPVHPGKRAAKADADRLGI